MSCLCMNQVSDSRWEWGPVWIYLLRLDYHKRTAIYRYPDSAVPVSEKSTYKQVDVWLLF